MSFASDSAGTPPRVLYASAGLRFRCFSARAPNCEKPTAPSSVRVVGGADHLRALPEARSGLNPFGLSIRYHRSARVLEGGDRPAVSLRVACTLGLLLAAASSTSCYTQGETTCGQESEALAPLRGKVVDVDGKPIAGSLVFVELCGLYTANPNKALAHPNYRYGAIAGADGSFEVSVPRGPVGLHTFKPGFRYGSLEVADSTAPDVLVRTAALLPNDPVPKVAGFESTAPSVAPRAEIPFRAQVTASSPKDPISEEVLVLDPRTGVARAFNPPFRRTNDAFLAGFPSGTWTAAMPAPAAPGEYEYIFGFTSEHCIVGDIMTTRVTVR